jgi:hypothetical protein
LGAFLAVGLLYLLCVIVRAPIKLDKEAQKQIREVEEENRVLRKHPNDDLTEQKVAEKFQRFSVEMCPVLEFLLDRERVKREQLNLPGMSSNTIDEALKIGRETLLIDVDEVPRGGVRDRYYFIPQVYKQPLKDLLGKPHLKGTPPEQK